MALDVYIMQRVTAPRIGDELVLQFADDSYFVFLYPLLKELQKATGQEIELYEDAFFCGADLVAMLETISQARVLLAAQPETWREHVRTLTKTGEKFYSFMRKTTFEAFLDQWESAVIEAQQRDAFLVFFGD